MKISLDSASAGALLVQAYHPGCVVINGQRLRAPLLLTPERLLPDWSPAPELCIADLQPIMELQIATVLFGTGLKPCFPSADVLLHLESSGIGYEVMNTAAACRSYNVLASELRRVAIALLADP